MYIYRYGVYPNVGETPRKHLLLDLAGRLLSTFAALSAMPS